jgi:hypothetical protein
VSRQKKEVTMATKQQARFDPQGSVTRAGPERAEPVLDSVTYEGTEHEARVVVGRVLREAPGSGVRALGRVVREAPEPGAHALGRLVRQSPEPGAYALGRVVREPAA